MSGTKTTRKLFKSLVIAGCIAGMLGQPVSALASNVDGGLNEQNEVQTEQTEIGTEQADTEQENTGGLSGNADGQTTESEDEQTESDETENTTAAETETTAVNESETISGEEGEAQSESAGESNAESESIEETTAQSESDTGDENGIKVENSWRFDNGVWSGNYGITPFSENGFEPWTKVDGSYINSEEDVIVGAIARGIDVSEWQGKIDWEKVINDDVSFAIIRCGASLTYDDQYWEYNTSECERLGLPYGVYFYSYANDVEEAKQEAEHCLRLLRGHAISYPVYLDLEDDWVRYVNGGKDRDENGNKIPRSAAEIAEVAKVFIDTVSAAGYEVSVYANTDWWNNVLTDPYFNQFSSTRWVAQYNSTCTYKGNYMMWQCTSNGKIDGITANSVDINMIYTDRYGLGTQKKMVTDFVTRLYTLVLERNPDPTGLNEWVQVLMDKETTGAEVVRDFILSPEFVDKNVSDEAYIEILYNTCMNRPSDNNGKSAWLKRFEDGFSRTYVLRGFIESDEFSKICKSYGIERGNIKLTEYRDQNDGVTRYVTRCYSLFLERRPDVEGLNDWARLILEDKDNAKDLPEGFIGSREFIEKNVSDEEFVKICYRAVLDREADQAGLDAWIKRLEKGDSRKKVCEGFTDSIEFKKLLANYGL